MPTACVTGATGYVATELIKQLLAKGYAVKATVRGDPQSPRLQRLAADVTAAAAAAAAPGGGGSCGNLQLVQVPDIEAPSEALDSALAGAEILFHVASPFRFDGDPVKDIVQPAVQGTRTVLEAAAKYKGAGGLRRVVVTSSVCAIHDMNRKQVPQAEQYCEADWNSVSTIEDEAYWVSKVEAEKLAWKLAEELGLDVVTILPNFVLGPVTSGDQGGVSVGFMKGILESPADKEFTGSWTVVDVRDVADAHIRAAEDPTAKGRYIISQPASISARFVSDTLKAAWPDAATALPDGAEAEPSAINSARVVTELGLQYTPVADTMRDMAGSLLRTGTAAPAWYQSKSGQAS